MLICGGFTLGKLYGFDFAHFCCNGVLYFSLKIFLVEQVLF